MTLREHIENRIIEEIKKASDEDMVNGDRLVRDIDDWTTGEFCKFCHKLQGGTCRRERCPTDDEASGIMQMEYEA